MHFQMQIDAVIRWAGAPSQLKYEKCKAMGYDPENVFPQPTSDLKYCLRGLLKYASWVRNIYLVIDDDEELPEWLDVNNKLLTLVRHSEFIPYEFLPTYNSNVIDSYLHCISGLSDYFIVLDDDTFICKKVLPSTFFNPRDNLPIIRHYQGADKHKTSKKPSCLFVEMWQKGITKYDFKYTRIQHQVMPFSKALVAKYVNDVFHHDVYAMVPNKIRASNDVNALRFSAAYASSQKHAHMVKTSDEYDLFVEGPNLKQEQCDKIAKSATRPTFLCINNTHASHKLVYKLLNKVFPNKCDLEVNKEKEAIKPATQIEQTPQHVEQQQTTENAYETFWDPLDKIRLNPKFYRK